MTGKVKLSPPVSDLTFESRGYIWVLDGIFEPETTYQLTIPAGVRSSTGEAVQEDLVYNVKIPPLSPDVRFLTEGPYYPAVRVDGQPERVSLPLGVTNMRRVSLSLYRVYTNNLALRDTLSSLSLIHISEPTRPY